MYIALIFVALVVGVCTGWLVRNAIEVNRPFDGSLVVSDTPTGGKRYSLELEDMDPWYLDEHTYLRFKVVHEMKPKMPRPPS